MIRLLIIHLFALCSVVLANPSNPLYFQNFDVDDGNWTSTVMQGSTGWQYGQVVRILFSVILQHKPTINSCYSGSCWTSGSLTANYEDNLIAFLDSPVFDFSNVTSDPILSFYNNFVTELNYDGAQVRVTTDNWYTYTTLQAQFYNYNTVRRLSST